MGPHNSFKYWMCKNIIDNLATITAKFQFIHVLDRYTWTYQIVIPSTRKQQQTQIYVWTVERKRDVRLTTESKTAWNLYF